MLDPAIGETYADAAFVLINPLEIVTEMVMRLVDGGAQQALQPIP